MNILKPTLQLFFLGCIIMVGQSPKEGTRQIHLDFHTSEVIQDIGSEFSKAQFQEALKTAKVNSINIFSKGHHGWSYYNTKVGKKHPHLDFDLLQEQIEACHEIGIRAQAYYTIGWSAKDAREHPEWIIKDKEGKEVWFGSGLDDEIKKGEKLYPFYSWATLSPEGAYLDLILAEVEELAKNYDLDGFWFDIVPFQYPNYSELGRKDLMANGIDLNDDKAVERHHIKKMKIFLNKTREIVKKYKPNASIFYNWTTHFNIPQSLDYQLEQYNTKLDLEDLPTTWDGYDLFPLRAKYYGNLDMDYVAMSGKFHTAWGEFGGFKHKDAIWYEAASMVAFGANANFGDQLHPSGRMDMETYRNIGHAFDYVERIEDYGVGAEHEASVGIWFANKKRHDEGLVRMLLENQVDFVMASNRKDWSNLEVIILSGGVALNPADVKRIQGFMDNGGKLLVMGKGAMDRKNKKFHFDMGVNYLGDAEYDVDYTIAGDEIAANLVRSPFLNYEPSLRVEVEKGTIVLAHLREPFFNRRIHAYSSHQNTPYRQKNAAHPAVTRKGNIIFIPSDLAKGYFRLGARVHRDLFYNCLSQLSARPMVEVDMPSAGRVNLLHQPDKSRYVLHLLYASPHQRGKAQVIEDIVPLYDVPVTMDLHKEIKKVYAIPSMQPVEFKRNGGKYTLKVKKLEGHIGLVFEY